MTLSTGEVLNNRYRIVKLLRQGGYGAVYRVWDLNMECPRALKENLDVSLEAQQQFKREAKFLGDLVHPNLPRVTDHFILPDQGQYLVMDFVEGKDLQEMLDESGEPLSVTQLLEWADQICDALVYMHNQNPPIIHRDIKPANIKITPQGRAMLVDFGIAKIMDSGSRTAKGAKAITPGFSPPEQYGVGATDAQSDIYSLGATLYYLLTSESLPDSVDLLANIAPASEPVEQRNPTVSTQVSRAIQKAMQLNREERWRSMADFKVALRAEGQQPRILSVPVAKMSSETVSLRPSVSKPPDVKPEIKEKPRNKVLIGIIGGFLLVGFIGLIILGLIYAANNIVIDLGSNPTSAFLTAIATARIATELSIPAIDQPPTSTPSLLTATTITSMEDLTPSPVFPSQPVPTQTGIILTNWDLVYFQVLQGSNLCKFQEEICWKSNAARGVLAVKLVGKDRIFIDPSWNNPRLAFWHKYDFLGGSMITALVYGKQEILFSYPDQSKSDWKKESLDLNRYKGMEITFIFTADVEQQTIGGGFWGSDKYRRTEWILQDIQVVPNY